MIASRLLRKTDKTSPSITLRASTPWFFAALCFLWASFLTVTMLSNEQSVEFNRERINREVEERVMRELVKREERRNGEGGGNLDEENNKRPSSLLSSSSLSTKAKRRGLRGPLAGAYRRAGGQLGKEEDEDKENDDDDNNADSSNAGKKKTREFRGPFGRMERLIFEKSQQRMKLELERAEKERTRRALDAHLEDADKDEEKTPRDTLDVEEKIQEALGRAIEKEKSHDEEEDEDEKRRRLIETDGGDGVVSREAVTTMEEEEEEESGGGGGEPKSFPKSVYGQAHLLKDLPGFPKTPPLVLSAVKPKAYLFRNFLSSEECDHLMKLAKEQLAPSTVVGAGGTSVPSTIRTSAGMFLSKAVDKTLENIEYRIAAASGTPEPNGEGMQILRYDVGQKYDPHFDYFHDAVNPSPKRGGQRMATMLIYLENTEEGGETIFPRGTRSESFDLPEEGNPHEWSDCTSQGLPVKSVKGDALLFWSLTEDYKLDMGSLHGACPVVKGQKWTAVKWIRVAKFDGMFTSPLPMPALSRRTELHGKCVDEWDECAQWAKDGWCEKNKDFMVSNSGARDSKGPACPVSCNVPCPEK